MIFPFFLTSSHPWSPLYRRPRRYYGPTETQLEEQRKAKKRYEWLMEERDAHKRISERKAAGEEDVYA